MPHWDVFHSERLEVGRSWTAEAVREALGRGDLVEDDLIRPAGETRWTRLGDSPEFAALASRAGPASPIEPPPVERGDVDDPPESGPARPVDGPAARPSPDREAREPGRGFDPPQVSDFELVNDEIEVESDPEPPPTSRTASKAHEPPVLPDEEAEGPDLPELIGPGGETDFDIIVEDDDEEEEPEPEFDPQGEDDEAAEFTLSRNSAERVEELDLAAMVDVAFQLVLFFLVTAQVVLFKTLEVPRPDEDKPPEAAAQARTKSVDELEKDYILVEVDAAGAIKVDRQPVAASRPALVERLRKSREDTARKAMLLSADFATRHENAVLVFDVANEIDLKIAIAQPAAKK